MNKQDILENATFNATYKKEGDKTTFYIVGTVFLNLELSDKKIFKYSQENKVITEALSAVSEEKCSPDLQNIVGIDYKSKALKKYRRSVDIIANKLKLAIDKAIALEKFGSKKVCKIELKKVQKIVEVEVKK